MKKDIIIPSVILLIAVTALFSGCRKDSGNTEYPDVTASEYAVSGSLKYKYTLLLSGRDTIVDWPFGAASLKVSFGDTAVITAATVNADGTFQLVLPASVKGVFFSSMAGLASQQGGTVIAAPETLRFMRSAQFKVEYTETGLAKTMIVNLYKLRPDFTVDKSYHYNFYDSDGTFIGTGATGNIYNWTFAKGWGLVESSILNPGFAPYNSISVATASSGAIWVNI